jgi:hypothetical protein
MRPQREYTVTSERVQGPGTWVKLKRLTWGEVKPFLGKDVMEKVAAQVLDWNWTDDAGNPLPLPKSGADMQGLLAEETGFLLDAVNSYELGANEAKN